MRPVPTARAAQAAEIAGSRAGDLIELTKPRITGMVLVTTCVGYLMAASGSGSLTLLVCALAGTGLVTAGAQTINQLMERRTDALMLRTRDRPIPAGRVQPTEAFIYGTLLSVSGVAILAVGTNALTALLSCVALGSYLFAYTPLKRITTACTLVGAVPGAIPPVMGWTAARGGLEPTALALFAILFAWQIPHFLAIAWMYREDYARAGLTIISVGDPDGAKTARGEILWSAALVAASLTPTALGAAGWIYGGGALLFGAGFFFVAAGLARRRTVGQARTVLLASVIYLPVLLGLMLLDRIPPA
jgi:protoheme IX farnesyltransferase